VFVHEGSNDYKMLFFILQSSDHIFFVVKHRKTFLAGLLADHGIWQDAKNWRECMQYTISMKVEDANQRKKKRH